MAMAVRTTNAFRRVGSAGLVGVFATLTACSANDSGGEAGGPAPMATAGSGGGGSSATGGTFSGGGSGSILDGGNSGNTLDPDAACLVDTNEARLLPSNLLFQLDISGSMNCDPDAELCATDVPHPGSRWDIFKQQMKNALDALPDSMVAGVMHYPTGSGLFSNDPTGCVPQQPDIPLGPLSQSRVGIFSQLDLLSPAGGTPTHDAVLAAHGVISQTALDGNDFVVLATDGQSTFCAGCDISCGDVEKDADDQQLVATVAQAATNGTRTFVLGVPGSEGYRGVLSQLAEAGGTAKAAGCSASGPEYCHYDLTTAPDFSVALGDALAAVSGEALSCVYDIPESNGDFDPNQINVQFSDAQGSEDILKDPSRQNGWDYSDDGNQIVLHGIACERVKTTPNGRIDILFGCPTVVR